MIIDTKARNKVNHSRTSSISRDVYAEKSLAKKPQSNDSLPLNLTAAVDQFSVIEV